MRELASRSRLEEGSEPTTRDYVLAASQMITDRSGTPPEVLRAVFGFLSGLPGMKLVGDVTDPLGARASPSRPTGTRRSTRTWASS